MAEPTKSQLKQDIYSAANEAGTVTSNTKEQQTKAGETAERLEGMAASMTVSDAQKIMQLSARFRNNDASSVTELDAMINKYGPDFTDVAARTLMKVNSAAPNFVNAALYNEASAYARAATINDPTYTSPEQSIQYTTPEQSQIAQISGATEAKMKKMYDQRKKELAEQAPTFQPLSNDPSMNQMFLGMAMQGAAGLLALVDPKAAAMAASEIGTKTIDQMYARKQQIDAVNVDLQKKYMDAMGKHAERGDAAWKAYFDGVMEERKDLKNTMQRQISDEYKNLIASNTQKADALKKQVESLAEQGKLSQGDAKQKLDAIDKRAGILIKLLERYQKEEDDAKRLGYLYARMGQDKINTGLQAIQKQAVVTDPETLALYKANFYLLKDSVLELHKN